MSNMVGGIGYFQGASLGKRRNSVLIGQIKSSRSGRYRLTYAAAKIFDLNWQLTHPYDLFLFGARTRAIYSKRLICFPPSLFWTRLRCWFYFPIFLPGFPLFILFPIFLPLLFLYTVWNSLNFISHIISFPKNKHFPLFCVNLLIIN